MKQAKTPFRFRFSLRTLICAVFLIGLVFCPFNWTIVPAWKIRVKSYEGDVLVGYTVREKWKTYGVDEDTLWREGSTDEHGIATFPPAIMNASLIHRFLIAPINSFVHGFVHSSYGTSASITVLSKSERFASKNVWSTGDDSVKLLNGVLEANVILGKKVDDYPAK